MRGAITIQINVKRSLPNDPFLSNCRLFSLGQTQFCATTGYTTHDNHGTRTTTGHEDAYVGVTGWVWQEL